MDGNRRRSRRRLKCPECHELFFFENARVNHKKDVHNIVTQSLYVCCVCDRVLGSKSSLQRHVNNHFLKETECVCDYPKCYMKFRSKSAREKHKLLEGHIKEKYRTRESEPVAGSSASFTQQPQQEPLDLSQRAPQAQQEPEQDTDKLIKPWDWQQ